MFTGIVEEIGILEEKKSGAHSAVLTIRARRVLEGLHLGDSIAVNGVCLTVTEFSNHFFRADVMHETMNRSTLSMLRCKDRVNLERAMPADGRFGGHIVAGHVDGTGRIVQIRRDDNAVWYEIEAGPDICRYIVEKGSIAVDGISLTVAKEEEGRFWVSVIPHTLQETILADKKTGDLVNLENDMIGKYVEKLLGAQKPQAAESRITREFLTRYGY